MEFIILAISIVFGVVGWLLSNKDRKQEIEISLLFKQWHTLEKEMSDFKLKVAENHYPKNELDKRFEQLNDTITKGFSGISDDMKEMLRALHDHIKEHHTGSGK